MKDKKLVFSVTRKDFEVQVFRCGGNGGQKVNKTSSGVRIIHRESGARGECRNFRSQKQNKDEAFRRLVEDLKFKVWLNRKLYDTEKLEKEIETLLNRSMEPQNLKLEVKKNGKWGVIDFDALS